jgi:hypothetical protein
VGVDRQRDAHVGMTQHLAYHLHGNTPPQQKRGGEDEWQGLEERYRDEPDGRERGTIASGGRLIGTVSNGLTHDARSVTRLAATTYYISPRLRASK